jgi:hypothetical protein
MTLCKDCNRWMCGLVDKELKTKCECQEFQKENNLNMRKS